jgi:hypothetical protein
MIEEMHMNRLPAICVLFALIATACGGTPVVPVPNGSTQSPVSNASRTPVVEETPAGFAVILEDLGVVSARQGDYEHRFRSLKFTNHSTSYQAFSTSVKCRDSEGVLGYESKDFATAGDKPTFYVIPPSTSVLLQSPSFLESAESKCTFEIARAVAWDSNVFPTKVISVQLNDKGRLEFVFENPGTQDIDYTAGIVYVEGYDAQGKQIFGDAVQTAIVAPAGEKVRSWVSSEPLHSALKWADPKIDRLDVKLVVRNQRTLAR